MLTRFSIGFSLLVLFATAEVHAAEDNLLQNGGFDVAVDATRHSWGEGTVDFDSAQLKEIPMTTTFAYDCARTQQTFLGFGAQVWADQDHGIALLQELNIRIIRISKDWASWEQLSALRRRTDEMGIQWLYLLWSAPEQYTKNGILRDVPGFAGYWVGLVEGLNERGMCPHVIDLMNEPDSGGAWSTGIPPKSYNELVKAVRKGLDQAGFEHVGIVGPGLTHLDWQGHNAQWFAALDPEAVEALTAFATHSWDDGDLGHGGPLLLEANWPDFGASADALDSSKPKWITEYATKETTFHGVTYPHPDKTGGYSAAFSMAYAVRTYANTLAHLNQGANRLFYWDAEDRGKSWGYVTHDGQRKPIFYTLLSLFPKIPVGATVLSPPDHAGAALYSAVLTHDDTVIVAVANDKTVEHQGEIRLTNAPADLAVTEAIACELRQAGDPAAEVMDTAILVKRMVTPVRNADGSLSMPVTLPADSTLTIILQPEPTAP